MRIVLDTNSVVSALLWGGPPLRLFRLGESGRITLCTSPVLYIELKRVLEYPRLAAPMKAQNLSTGDLLDRFHKATLPFDSPPIPPTIQDDPSDDIVLACALAARANTIVSGDRHLLKLRTFQGIPIMTATDFLEQFK